jgi:hypothetical protein
MFRETNHTVTEAIINLVRTLPEREQKFIAKTLNTTKTKKKTDKKELKKQQVLNDIRDGLLEIKEAKRTGKKLKSLEEFLNEI